MPEFRPLGPASDIPPGKMKRYDVDDVPVAVYNCAGVLYATHDTCTHGQASLADGFIEGEEIECPLHQGRFHIATGRAVGIPCIDDVRSYAVKIENGAVLIKE